MFYLNDTIELRSDRFGLGCKIILFNLSHTGVTSSPKKEPLNIFVEHRLSRFQNSRKHISVYYEGPLSFVSYSQQLVRDRPFHSGRWKLNCLKQNEIWVMLEVDRCCF